MSATVDIISYSSVHDKVVQERAQQQESGSVTHGIVGLTNLGNTCYLNTAMQCLANTNALTEYFLGFPWRDELNRENPLGSGGRMAEEFGELISEMWEVNKSSKKRKVITPSSFKKVLGKFHSQFDNMRQQDVQELLSFLLDGLHEDLNRVKNKPYVPDVDCEGRQDNEDELAVESWRGYLLRNRSIVVDIFQGQLRNALTCVTCNYKSLKFDPYMYMSVPCNAETTSLRHCLLEFCKPEMLLLDSQWYCPKCKKPRDAEKKLDLWIAPPIFIVHLKRFMQDEKGKRSKIDSLIEFPLTDFNLSEFLGKKTNSSHLYNLFGVANHHGSLARGHYTAFARHDPSNQWYKFNDSRIQEIGESDVVTKNAYMLFYSRAYNNDIQSQGYRMRLQDQTTEETGTECSLPVEKKGTKMLTVDMIRRQSITIPHHWPHNISTTFSSASLHPFDEDGEVESDDDLPRPSFFAAPIVDPVIPPGDNKYVVTTECNASSDMVKDVKGNSRRKYAKRKIEITQNYIDRPKRACRLSKR